MLKLTKKALEVLLACLTFSMVIWALPAFAGALTIDLSGTGAPAGDLSDRSVTVWRISDRPLADQACQDFVKEAEGRSGDELDASYSVWTGLTDRSGRISRDFSKGTYYVRVADKEGAVTIYPFTFISRTESHQVYPKGHRDTPPGAVDLFKISTDRAPLAGAIFKLYRVNGNALTAIPGPDGSMSFVTDAQGKIYKDRLEPGDYLFEEVRAPENYRIKKAKTYFTVTAGQTTSIEVVNYKDGEGAKGFKKISTRDNKPLAGARFLVTQKVGKDYVRVKQKGQDLVVTSSAQGTFEVDDLPYGDYFLWEVQAPEGYQALTGPVAFTINANSRAEDLLIKNKPVNGPPGKPSGPPPSGPPPSGSPPPKTINIPQTGDISLLLLALAGGICIILGRWLLKERQDS